jgi:hypothetical protein
LTTLRVIVEAYRLRSASLCNLLQPQAITCRLWPNIVSTLLSNTLKLCFSTNIRDQVSDSHKTRSKIMVPYILIFKI